MKRFKLFPLLLALLLLFGCAAPAAPQTFHNRATAAVATTQGGLELHFIDVGQGDAIFIRQENFTLLIDAGDNKYGRQVVDYLHGQGIQRVDYLIGTHPHADHIGGLDDMIAAFEIGEVILPKVSHNTKTFEAVLDAVDAKGLSITPAKAGQTRQLGEAAFTILSPIQEKYQDLNHYSVVVDLHHGQTSFLLMGDAEEINEQELLQTGSLSKTNLLKLGHHGSSTSSCPAFLQRVDPDIVVITCGAGNSYGHPHQEILQRLAGKRVLRTDESGTIVVESDGERVTVLRPAG